MKKKLFCVLAVVAVLSLGVVGALAAVPHAHGDDLDHSQHTSCPVHQFALAGMAAIVSTAVTAIFFSASFWLRTAKPFFVETAALLFTSSRAPPVPPSS